MLEKPQTGNTIRGKLIDKLGYIPESTFVFGVFEFLYSFCLVPYLGKRPKGINFEYASMRTSIETAQPKIVENHQGLLVDFRILGGYVGNELQGKSLLLDFGDIASRQARMGRWVMEASLAGRFVEFDASFTHADSLGGAVTSLIKQVRTHKLVRDVLVDLDGHDDIADFLAEEGGGYRVYDSAGGDAEVADVSAQARLTPASGSTQRLAFHAAKGLVHAKVADPFRGQKSIARVV